MNISVVVNYKEAALFARNDDSDKGYLQFTRSGDQVFITVDGKSVGFVPTAEFDRVASVVTPF